MSVRVFKTDIEVSHVPDDRKLQVDQLVTETLRQNNGLVKLQVSQEVVEGVRTCVVRNLEVAQFCIELLRPVAGYAHLSASLVAEASILDTDLSVSPAVPCLPCVPIYYNTDVVFMPYVTPEPPCEPNDCPVNDYRSE